ncbi:uncharacterized protein LOC118735042 [Rhagoletis pomonella]|uniref:uncharacterized protein LOC118735042 n=1 Tax=Rhagoletis pomonella TaxID=28610 RepID=UPI00177C4C17|nr:uncharacterized protein LOC118735042 [Rhagoletis pomonella]
MKSSPTTSSKEYQTGSYVHEQGYTVLRRQTKSSGRSDQSRCQNVRQQNHAPMNASDATIATVPATMPKIAESLSGKPDRATHVERRVTTQQTASSTRGRRILSMSS